MHKISDNIFNTIATKDQLNFPAKSVLFIGKPEGKSCVLYLIKLSFWNRCFQKQETIKWSRNNGYHFCGHSCHHWRFGVNFNVLRQVKSEIEPQETEL